MPNPQIFPSQSLSTSLRTITTEGYNSLVSCSLAIAAWISPPPPEDVRISNFLGLEGVEPDNGILILKWYYAPITPPMTKRDRRSRPVWMANNLNGFFPQMTEEICVVATKPSQMLNPTNIPSETVITPRWASNMSRKKAITRATRKLHTKAMLFILQSFSFIPESLCHT